MNESKPRMGNRSFWLNLDLAAEFCKTVKAQKLATVTEEMNMMIEKRLLELKGLASPDPSEKPDKVYERLSSKHEGLSRQKLGLKKLLIESGSYSRFLKVLSITNLEASLSGGSETSVFKETIRIVSDAGKKSGDTEGAANFVRLMRKVREMKTLQVQLDGLETPIGSMSEVKVSEASKEEEELDESEEVSEGVDESEDKEEDEVE